jgi:anti-anti-sigma factor
MRQLGGGFNGGAGSGGKYTKIYFTFIAPKSSVLSMNPMLRVEVEHAAGSVCVRCDGALLRGGGLERLSELAGTLSAQSVVVDLARVPRIDAHGIGVLAGVAERVQRRGARIKMSNVPRQVRTVLDTCGLSALLDDTTKMCSPAA